MIKKHIKRFFEVLFKNKYKSVDERIQDAKYLTRINIVIMVLAVLITLYNLGRLGIMLLEH